MNREQLKTILWLRWRLTRNQWARNGGLGAIIAVVVGVSAFVLGGLSFVGALVGAALGLGQASPAMIMGIWLGVTVVFLFFWMIGLLIELQRSETIDLQRLMHLPVALGQLFVVNYLASHLVLSIIIMVPAMTGLAMGLVIARGPAMLLLLPLALGMVFMITAWTYCLRGWLAAMMNNPRRRRTIIMGISLAFILTAQAPNLYFNVVKRHDGSSAHKTNNRQLFDQLLAARKFIPPFWVSLGAQRLAEGNAWPALSGTLGCFALGALGLRRAYRGTMRFYSGGTGGKARAQVNPSGVSTTPPTKTGAHFLELRIPAVPEQAAALALATFRSMLRAPEVKMAWATSFIITLILGGTVFLRSAPNLSDTIKPFIIIGVMAFSLFGLVQFLANPFGFDRDGFRALILSPADRRLILLGKNLAGLPVGTGFSLLLLTLTSVWLRLSPLIILAGLFQLMTMLLLAGLGGNVLAILMPYRIQPGSLKATKLPGLIMLAIVLCQMLFPVIMTPVLVPPLAELLWQKAGWPPAVPVNLLLSVVLAALVAFLYWQTLAPLGRLLQRRETKILNVVTADVE
ncbi:MAG: hypothetical protein ABR955_12735 [Verrucomicrobiota bacterium]|jgi:hypothetical protein